MKWTLLTLKLFPPRSGRTVGQLSLGYRCDSLEVIMAGVTEVGGTEAEKDSDRATVATLVFQEIRPMLWTHLGPRDVRAPPTHQLPGVIVLSHPYLVITAGLTSIISLFAFVADIVGISVHGKPSRVLVEASPGGGDGLGLV